MTYLEAIKSGYCEGDTKYQRGYISRKTDINNQIVRVAGGSRHGDLYVIAPCYHSTQYVVRVYLRKEV